MHEVFADHVVLQAVFQHHTTYADRWIWPKPLAIKWNDVPDLVTSVDFSCGDPSDQYHQLWAAREELAAQHLPDWNHKMSGRGSVRSPIHKKGWPAPLKKGRSCDVGPSFHGFSCQHAKWFKQLRRLQSYCRWISARETTQVGCPSHGILLWRSILQSSGFTTTFTDWWPSRLYQCPQDVAHIPQVAPPYIIANSIYQAFVVEVRALESQLLRAKQTHAKCRREHDPALIFKDLRKPFAQPVETLLEIKKSCVSHVDLNDMALELDPPCTFDPELPLAVEGHTLEVNYAEPDKIWVNNMPEVTKGSYVTQTKHLGSLPAIFEAFHEQWKKRWCKHDNVPHSQWEDIISFAAQVIPPVQAPQLALDVDLLRAECHKKKATAATGLDGASRNDFLSAGPVFLQSILNMYSRAEEDGRWPVQVMAGAVSSLAKTPMASTTNEFRPITIFGFSYRCWASLNARHLLDYASTWVDAGVYGNRKGLQAAHLWRTIVQSIETAYATNQPLSGLTADIEKAFNCLPRWPVFCAARFAGTPTSTLFAWGGAVAQMCRHFRVRDSFSQGFQTSTGLAEGCALSCYGMLLLDHCFHRWVTSQAAPPVVFGYSYVDNWDLITWDSTWAIRQLDIVLSFARMTDLTVDRGKTYGWSTDPEVRKQFRAAGIPVHHAARDLGAHISYTRQFSNSTVCSRLDSLDELWENFRKSSAPYAQKIQAIRSIAWPRGLHAISSAPVGHTKWTSVRSKAAQALLGRRAGLNPGILLGLVEGSADPEEVALLSTVRDLRAFSSESFMVDSVVPIATNLIQIPANSPAHILLTRLHQVGLSVNSQGLVVDRFGVFDCYGWNYNEVALRLQWAWQRRAADFVSHRQDFDGIQWVDAFTTRKRLSALDVPHQALFRLGLAGGSFTADASTHWSDSGSSACKWCGCVDSLHHRYWTCAHTRHFRSSLATDVVPLLNQLPPALTLRGWALHCPSWPQWISLLTSLPREIPAVVTPFVLDRWNHVFTDGSCLWQSHPNIRVAAWSSVIASPFTDSWTFDVRGILGSAHLPGLCQTAFRAELYALAFTLHHAATVGASVHVWSDCLGVVNVFHLLTKGKGHVKPNSSNGDLWLWILNSVERLGMDKIRVCKVKAHQKIEAASSRFDVWQWWNNGAADRAARMSNASRPPCFWKIWSTYAAEYFHACKLHEQVVAVHMAVADFSIWTGLPEDEPLKPAVVRLGRTFTKFYDDGLWQGNIPVELLRAYGMSLCRKIVCWWTERCRGNSPDTLTWVPLTLLYVDFQLTYGCVGPLKIGKQWVEHKTRPFLDAGRYPHTTRVRWFRSFLTAFLKFSKIRMAVETCKPECESVQAFVPCASLSWDSACLFKTERWMHQHLKVPCTRDSKVLRNLPLATADSSMAIQLPLNTSG